MNTTPQQTYTNAPISLILDRSLSHSAFVLYMTMLATDAHTSSELAELRGRTERHVRQVLAELVEKGLVTKSYQVSPEFAKKTLCSHKKPSSISPLYLHPNTRWYNCEWCTSQTVILHEHHWPIPKRDGGTNTVNICAGCHAEYHFLTRETYQAVVFDGGAE